MLTDFTDWHYCSPVTERRGRPQRAERRPGSAECGGTVPLARRRQRAARGCGPLVLAMLACFAASALPRGSTSGCWLTVDDGGRVLRRGLRLRVGPGRNTARVSTNHSDLLRRPSWPAGPRLSRRATARSYRQPRVRHCPGSRNDSTCDPPTYIPPDLGATPRTVERLASLFCRREANTSASTPCNPSRARR